MANDQMRNLKNGRIIKITDCVPVDRRVYFHFDTAMHTLPPTAPVIYPDEEFDFPVDDDGIDPEPDSSRDPEEDDMVPVYPCGVSIPTGMAAAHYNEVMKLSKERASRLAAERDRAAAQAFFGEVLRPLEEACVKPFATLIEKAVAEHGVTLTDKACAIILPTTKSELEYLRQTIAALPDGLKAVIYRDLYNEGLRVTDVLSTDKKMGAADRYMKEFES